MAYKIIITAHAAELIDNCVEYLKYNLSNNSAAIHLLDQLESIFNRAQDNPYQFPVSSNPVLAFHEYREAVTTGMRYRVIIKVDNEVVYIVGVFHELENYVVKIKEPYLMEGTVKL